MIPAEIGTIRDDPELLGLIVAEKAGKATEHDHKLVVWIEGESVCCSVDATYRAAAVLEQHPGWLVGIYRRQTIAHPSPPGKRKRGEHRQHWYLDDAAVRDDIRDAIEGLLSAA